MSKISRNLQKVFRHKLINRDKRCLITSAPPIICEAAHIVEVKNHRKHPDINIYHPSNGLLLRSDIHRLFDLNYWTIYPQDIIDSCKKTNQTTFRIVLHPYVLDEDFYFKELINKNITVPTSTIPYFFKRYEL